MTPQPRSKHDSGREALPLIPRIKAMCVVSENGCWEWQGAVVGNGYGRTKIGSRRDGTRKSVLVHRAVWEEKHGPIPEGMTIDHKCNNTCCCNPKHLRLMTLKDNILRSDGLTAQNARKARCPKCGGPYSEKPGGGGRECRPCKLAYFRDYNAKRSGQRKLGMRG